MVKRGPYKIKDRELKRERRKEKEKVRCKVKNDKCQRFGFRKFICVDGEGKSIGEPVMCGGETVKHHVYDRMEAYCEGKHFERDTPGVALSTVACLDFLLHVSAEHTVRGKLQYTAMVGFALGYDVTHILHDLTVEQFKELARRSKHYKATGIPYRMEANGKRYELVWLNRKQLDCRMWQLPMRWTKDKKGKPKRPPCDGQFTLWDVWGFFQGSFVKAIEDWLCEKDEKGKPIKSSYPNLELIARMKQLRGEFDKVPPDEIAAYNRAEVEALEKIMLKLWDALSHPDVDLILRRWDGAGAIAAAMLMKHKIKEHLQDTQTEYPEVFEAARYGYAGGRIEAGDFGISKFGEWFTENDINSAYPDGMCDLPSLAGAVWVHGFGEPPKGFTIVHLNFEFPRGRKFYPLFWRSKSGGIVFPPRGEGWYWRPEYDLAREYEQRYGFKGKPSVYVQEWWHCVPATSENPLAAMIRTMFALRAKLKDDPTAGGAQMVLKLGLNSLYGKQIQQLGAEIAEDGTLIKRPPFFQIEYAGYVTSYTRAKLLMSHIDNIEAISLLATDGIVAREATRKANVKVGKGLGEWEEKRHHGAQIMQPGVYALNIYNDDDAKVKFRTRGYAAENARVELNEMVEAWKQKKADYKLGTRLHMITLTEAAHIEAFWPFRGCFREQQRTLRIDGFSVKRQAADLTKVAPHKQLVATKVQDIEDIGAVISAPYNLGWKARQREEEHIVLQEDDYG